MRIVLYHNGGLRGRAVLDALHAADHPPADTNPKSILGGHEYDLAIVAGSPRIFTAEEIVVPRYGFINCHAGKLPEYRGGSPLNWALVNGEKSVTATVLQMDEGIDTGKILREEGICVGDHDISVLHERVNAAFPRLILEVIEGIACGAPVTPRKQKGKARYWPQRTAADSEITLDMTPQRVYNKVRACREPYPAFIRLGKHCYKMELKDE